VFVFRQNVTGLRAPALQISMARSVNLLEHYFDLAVLILRPNDDSTVQYSTVVIFFGSKYSCLLHTLFPQWFRTPAMLFEVAPDDGWCPSDKSSSQLRDVIGGQSKSRLYNILVCIRRRGVWIVPFFCETLSKSVVLLSFPHQTQYNSVIHRTVIKTRSLSTVQSILILLRRHATHRH
jgi:hypothetical protein